jgi:hypothetical protein
MAFELAKVNRVLTNNPLLRLLLDFEAPSLIQLLVTTLGMTEQEAVRRFDQARAYLAVYRYMKLGGVIPPWYPKPTGLPPKLHEVLRIYWEDLRVKNREFYNEDPSDQYIADHETRMRGDNPQGSGFFFWMLHHLLTPFEPEGTPPSDDVKRLVASTILLLGLPYEADLWR